MCKKVFIACSSTDYVRMFEERGWTVVSSPDSADLIQFTGGSDVSPSLYGEKMHPYATVNLTRDKADKFIYANYEGKKPMAGICRGGQFLNVMNGGKMFQHIDGHLGNHTIVTEDGDFLEVTSTHHQMMRPSLKGVVKATCSHSVLRETMRGDLRSISVGKHRDIEVVIYPETKSLCFQPHPEFISAPKECTDYYFKLLEEIL